MAKSQRRLVSCRHLATGDRRQALGIVHVELDSIHQIALLDRLWIATRGVILLEHGLAATVLEPEWRVTPLDLAPGLDVHQVPARLVGVDVVEDLAAINAHLLVEAIEILGLAVSERHVLELEAQLFIRLKLARMRVPDLPLQSVFAQRHHNLVLREAEERKSDGSIGGVYAVCHHVVVGAVDAQQRSRGRSGMEYWNAVDERIISSGQSVNHDDVTGYCACGHNVHG